MAFSDGNRHQQSLLLLFSYFEHTSNKSFVSDCVGIHPTNVYQKVREKKIRVNDAAALKAKFFFYEAFAAAAASSRSKLGDFEKFHQEIFYSF